MEVERNPDYFLRMEFEPRLNKLRGRVAELLGADRDEVVFVPSVANGMNTVLRNFEWEEGDILVPSMPSCPQSSSRMLTFCPWQRARRLIPSPALSITYLHSAHILQSPSSPWCSQRRMPGFSLISANTCAP